VKRKQLAAKLKVPRKLLPYISQNDLERIRERALFPDPEPELPEPKEELKSADFDSMRAVKAFRAGDQKHLGCLLVSELARCVPTEHGLDKSADFMELLKPRSGLESLLLSQMAACYMAAMKELSDLSHSKTNEGSEFYTGRAVRLMRCFCMQIEALQTLRGKGKQKITVKHQHFNVMAAGSAVVGVREGV